MGGGKDKTDRGAEEQAAAKRAEAERQRAEGLAQRATELSQPLPIETQALETGVGRLGEVAGLALDPQQFLGRLQPQVQALTQGAGQEIFEQLAPEFQRRGLTQSGLFPEKGSRALVQQALGISRLVLGAGQQFLGLGAQAGGQLAGIGQTARGRQIQGGLTGLGFAEGGLQRGFQGEEAGVQRGFQAEQAAAQRAAQQQQAMGQAIGTLGGLALAPLTGGASAFLTPLAMGGGGGGSPLQQAGGPLTFGGFQKSRFGLSQLGG